MENQLSSPYPLADESALLRGALTFIGDRSSDGDDLPPLYVDIDASNGGFRSRLAQPPRRVGESDDVQAAPVSAHENDTPPLPVWPGGGMPDTTKRKENQSRNNRRLELQYLREMVGELESKLEQVRRQGDEQKLVEASSEEARSSVLVRAAWEQVAARQSEERHRVEMENIRLKRLLEDQIQVGKSLERLLRKRPKLEVAGQKSRGHPEKRMQLTSSPSSRDAAYIFQELQASCESQYLEPPGVLTKVLQLTEDQLNDYKVELVHDDDLGMVMRATESRILPFDFELVTQEFWDATPGLARANSTDIRDIEKSDNLIKIQFQAHAALGRVDGYFTVSVVVRRFCEQHRTVITSSAVLDPSEFSDMKMDGIYVRYRSWFIFAPIMSDASRPNAPTKAATRLISFSVTVPQGFDGLEDQSRKVGTLTNFLMSALSVDLETRQQEFENRLFDRSRERAIK